MFWREKQQPEKRQPERLFFWKELGFCRSVWLHCRITTVTWNTHRWGLVWMTLVLMSKCFPDWCSSLNWMHCDIFTISLSLGFYNELYTEHKLFLCILPDVSRLVDIFLVFFGVLKMQSILKHCNLMKAVKEENKLFLKQ